ncbi:hypothetical protein BJX70DRAFT_381745 [Aspergillus crustosus]
MGEVLGSIPSCSTFLPFTSMCLISHSLFGCTFCRNIFCAWAIWWVQRICCGTKV